MIVYARVKDWEPNEYLAYHLLMVDDRPRWGTLAFPSDPNPDRTPEGVQGFQFPNEMMPWSGDKFHPKQAEIMTGLHYPAAMDRIMELLGEET